MRTGWTGSARSSPQSHAAISATAKGLELVAKGTGETLARQTAEIVAAEIGRTIEGLNPAERLDQLGWEVAHLTAQSRIWPGAPRTGWSRSRSC